MPWSIVPGHPRPDVTRGRRTAAEPGRPAAPGSSPAASTNPATEGAAWTPAAPGDALGSGHGRPPAPPGLRLARLGPDCPARPVDWRWERAGLLLTLGLRGSRRRDDGPTCEARRFRAALGRCRDEGGRRLAARMPAVAGASAISTGPPPLRWAVEAWLLAGEPPATIASKMGMAVEAVAWYEALFFNVSDRLGSRGYIAHAAIGQAAHPGLGVEDPGTFWKLIGYYGGPAVLDLAFAATAAGPAGSASVDGEAIRAALTRLRLSLTPLAPSRAPRRRSPPGEAQLPPRLAASGRRQGRRSADPPPPGVPIELIEPSATPGVLHGTGLGRRRGRHGHGRDRASDRAIDARGRVPWDRLGHPAPSPRLPTWSPAASAALAWVRGIGENRVGDTR